ncbi:major facilitator superfamily protein [Chrysochromulina tobinii]|uniref:Major facilitator superfamily protein n=1 Tax=Chrysochromulina tobinii TaxID=1460289 RepID=A0A0M0LQC9_9EUKA|nr:major facilitator superfamily protein [Chrysochromulina tobinii]|eukprot:KOO53092.1 major facilitator superfamily protein [Chrysochromulina sp. CCMP291]
MPEPAAPLTKGYLAVLGGVMIHLVCGSLYCWGNLVTYMPASLKYWSPEGGEGPSDAGLVLAFTLLSQMCGMPFGPLFESLVGPRLTALLGGAMMASGLWLASSATTLTQFVLSYAVLFGLGIGLSYQMPFITGGRWFPGKKGSVQGVVMTGLGSSAFFFNMLCTHLLNPQKLWLMIIMSATSGINIASSYKTFALKQPNLNSEAFLALVGSIAALGGNAAGRFFWGTMSDKFGFRRCFLTLTALQASTMLVYRKLAERRLTFALGTQVMLFCMSGNFVMFPAHCFRTFGANGAAVYSFLFTAFGSAALLGPVLTKALLAKGGYALAYNVFAALSLLALLLGSLV